MSVLLGAATRTARYSTVRRQSNCCAVLPVPRATAWRAWQIAVFIAITGASAVVRGQEPPPGETHDHYSAGQRAASFLAGGAIGLAAHESGHLLADIAFGEKPGLRKVDFHGIPFFAITHRSGLPPRKEFTISSAGFWVQHAENEWMLSRERPLRDRGPLAKGVFTFNVLTSAAYAGAAFAKTGPAERDTRGIAEAARVDERWIGALVLAPAVLDAWRYFHPDAKWPVWTSRGVKVGMAVLIVR